MYRFKITLLSAWLGLSLINPILAQFKSRHEVTFGTTAGYFFDSRGLKGATVRELKRKILPVVAYTYQINKYWGIGARYSYLYFDYLPVRPHLRVPDNTLLERTGRSFGVFGRFRLRAKAFSFNLKSGLVRSSSVQLIHATYSEPSSWFREPYFDVNEFESVGLTTALNISHPIYWRFFGEIDCEYNLFNTDFDARQLFLSYRIGFRF